MSDLLLALAFFPLLLLALIAILNTFTFPRLKPAALTAAPRLAVLIPMRNEAAVITGTVRSLLDQDYPNFEVLILDDDSGDGSAALAHAAAAGDVRLRVISGQTLPAGWLGKPWACHQLAERADGEILLFTDADVQWQPGALSAVVAELATTRADLLTVWPRQETRSWPERLVVPLMNFSILAYLPALAVHFIPWRVFAAAIGQCLVFRRAAYAQLGGHAAIRTRITDDMAFAYVAKARGLRFRMADSSGLLTCRMYHDWDEVRRGYAKNILAGHGNSLGFLAFSTVFHWWLFVWPWLFLAGAAWLRQPAALEAAMLEILLGLLVRALTAAFSRQRLEDAVLMPVSVALMTLIAAQAVVWRFRGGAQWKGRRLSEA